MNICINLNTFRRQGQCFISVKYWQSFPHKKFPRTHALYNLWKFFVSANLDVTPICLFWYVWSDGRAAQTNNISVKLQIDWTCLTSILLFLFAGGTACCQKATCTIGGRCEGAKPGAPFSGKNEMPPKKLLANIATTRGGGHVKEGKQNSNE